MQKTSKLSRDGAVWGLLMVAPTIIGLLVLNIWPFIETIYMSFSKSLPFGEFEFEGLDNYIEMFQNPEFWKATGNTILFCILTVPVGIFLALLVAVVLVGGIRRVGRLSELLVPLMALLFLGGGAVVLPRGQLARRQLQQQLSDGIAVLAHQHHPVFLRPVDAVNDHPVRGVLPGDRLQPGGVAGAGGHVVGADGAVPVDGPQFIEIEIPVPG